MAHSIKNHEKHDMAWVSMILNSCLHFLIIFESKTIIIAKHDMACLLTDLQKLIKTSDD